MAEPSGLIQDYERLLGGPIPQEARMFLEKILAEAMAQGIHFGQVTMVSGMIRGTEIVSSGVQSGANAARSGAQGVTSGAWEK